jgi:uncharacterized integral membrane protein
MEWAVRLNWISFAAFIGSPFGLFMAFFQYFKGNVSDPWYIFIPLMFLVGTIWGAFMRPVVLWNYRRAIKRMREETN